MDTMIRTESLGKKYRIRHEQHGKYVALRDVLADQVKKLQNGLCRLIGRGKADEVESGFQGTEEFWALKEINLEINQGERVGIIGRNGAGKTTLLKLLSRITEPSAGRITLHGRVASLLEVGTGFHPELTGRENIYLNGAILGMSRKEIAQKSDEIISFAGVEKFLDTPVKRYSTGMYTRLAFAVAAHLEPEILLVDEVLAVGDAEFQKKCLGKMKEVGKEGRTILFVSHNMNAVEQLCNRVIWIDGGEVRMIDQDVRKVIKEYLFGDENNSNGEWINSDDQLNNDFFQVSRFFLSDEHGELLEMPVSNDSQIWIQIEAEIRQFDPSLTMGYAIYSEDGILLYWSYQTDQAENLWPVLKEGKNVLRSQIPPRFLNEGLYKIELIGGLHFRKWLYNPGVNAPSIYLHIQGGLSDSPLWLHRRKGLLAPEMKWM